MSQSTQGFAHWFLPTLQPGGPAVLLLHGSGGGEGDLLPLGQALAPEAALLAPRGKARDEQGKPRFFRRLGDCVFDPEELRCRAAELADFVETVAVSYALRRDRLMVVGFSNGANMAAAMLLLGMSRFRAAALFRPIVPLVAEELPDLSGVPVFIAGGLQELPVYQEQTRRLAELLRAAGADVTLHWQEATHALAAPEVAAARQWLAPFGSVRLE